MLFSSELVAKAIHEQFEPVWVSVREVPLVTIDFGNGHKITRTLNGNVATYALHPDGTVLDVLPGIYAPEEYVAQLGQMQLLYKYAYSPGSDGLKPGERLANYHAAQAKQLADGKEPGKLEVNFAAAISKARIENPVKFAIGGQPVVNPAVSPTNTTTPAQIAVQQYNGGDEPQGVKAEPKPESKAAEALRGWKELADDTKLNETAHRKAIHGHLAKAGAVQPKDVTKWLYKEVLHADLDDPLLGLGEVLNKNYPFADEDARRTK